MPAPNFHHLEIFHAVARLESFSRASEELLISQPSVSLQVRDLERYYGAPLFHRQGRGIKLTDVGEVVFQYTHKLFDTVEEMRRSVDALRETVTGRLVLGASSTPGDYLAPRLLGLFRGFHPEVEVTLHIGNSDTITRQILAREIDLGLVGDRVTNDAIVCTDFYADELVVFGPSDHPLAGQPIPPERLSAEPFVMREDGSATRRIAEARLKELGVTVRVAMELGSNEAVKRAVAAGLGLGMLSTLALEVDTAAGYVKQIPVTGLECRRDFYVLYHGGRYLNRPQQAFLDLVTKAA